MTVTAFQSVPARDVLDDVPELLQAKPESELFYMERLRFAGEIPMILERRYVVAACCPGLREEDVGGRRGREHPRGVRHGAAGDWTYGSRDIDHIVRLPHEAGGRVKVILENCYLPDEHKIRLCEGCADVGADFVKTSTGSASGGAIHDDLRLMRRRSPPHVRVLEECKRRVCAGARNS